MYICTYTYIYTYLCDVLTNVTSNAVIMKRLTNRLIKILIVPTLPLRRLFFKALNLINEYCLFSTT